MIRLSFAANRAVEPLSSDWLPGQRHVGSAVQASSDAEPAILSVLSVVKKHNRIFTTDSTDNTDESQRSQNGCSALGKNDVFVLLTHAGQTD